MANFKLLFVSDLDGSNIEITSTNSGSIKMILEDKDTLNDCTASLYLDVNTAVKLCKELKRQISIAKENQLNYVPQKY